MYYVNGTIFMFSEKNLKIKAMKRIILTFLSLISINLLIGQHRDTHAHFDASVTSYIDLGKGNAITKINNLSSGSQLTVALWVKWGSKTATGVSSWANLITLADSTGSGDNGVFWLQHSQDNKKFEFAIMTTQGSNTTRNYIQSTTQPSEGVWYHLACVYDGNLSSNNMKLYVNGVLETTYSKKGKVRAIPAASKLNIGRWPNPSDNYRRFNGSMDEIFVYNTALNSTQINTLMNAADEYAASTSKAASLVSYYNFEDYDAVDLASSPNNGVVYSGVSFGDSDAENLPIELVQFNGENENSTVQLSWITSSEINNDYFTIEKSFNGVDFVEIATIKGAGNSNEILKYSYKYQESNLGLIYYRLRQTDFDGRFSESNIIKLNMKNTVNPVVYPNPVMQGSTITISSIQEDVVKIAIYNLSGKLMYEVASENTSELVVNTSDFKHGTYIIKFITTTTIKSELLTVN